MKFKETNKYLDNHLKMKSEEIGFFKIKREVNKPYNEVVFKSEKIYFTSYGEILEAK